MRFDYNTTYRNYETLRLYNAATASFIGKRCASTTKNIKAMIEVAYAWYAWTGHHVRILGYNKKSEAVCFMEF